MLGDRVIRQEHPDTHKNWTDFDTQKDESIQNFNLSKSPKDIKVIRLKKEEEKGKNQTAKR